MIKHYNHFTHSEVANQATRIKNTLNKSESRKIQRTKKVLTIKYKHKQIKKLRFKKLCLTGYVRWELRRKK